MPYDSWKLDNRDDEATRLATVEVERDEDAEYDEKHDFDYEPLDPDREYLDHEIDHDTRTEHDWTL